MTGTTYITTPIFEHPISNAAHGCRVLYKMECYQPSGSFKLRGMSRLIDVRQAQGYKSFVSSSGGNAGLAVAYCSWKKGLDATIVLPETTPEQVRDLLRAFGADVRVHGAVWDEADTYARALAASREAIYVSPFDDPLLWDGHSTLIDEVSVEGVRPDAVILSVGGGGLLCGVLSGMHRNAWTNVPVIAAETQGAASFAAALTAGKPVTIDSITSKATSLGARRVAEEAVSWSRRHEIRSVLISDNEAAEACAQFSALARVRVELACGAALAVLDTPSAPSAISGCDTVLLIVCGGAVGL